MEINKESIINDSTVVNLEWIRPFDPYNPEKKNEKLVDSVEFEISHKGIDKLEENIESNDEFIMCFVHFDAKTDNMIGIYLSVWSEDSSQNDLITPMLTESEKKVLADYALQKLKNEREESSHAN